jgi:hypothetical protein
MNKEYENNKRILYEMHGVRSRDQTHNVHHIVFKSEGGTNAFENLALLDRETHAFIHDLLDKMQKRK